MMKKQDILEATLDLAVEKGLGRISMQQIADRVNLKKSSLYSHFNSKDEIIESMYQYFRNKAIIETGNTVTDYGAFVEGHSLHEILTAVVNSYKEINSSSDIFKFYRMIMAERFTSPIAAQIMVEETNRMIISSKNLFYAISSKGIAKFENPEGAAFIFSMGVHSILDFEGDSKVAGTKDSEGKMEAFINEFCSVYGESTRVNN